MPRDGNSFSDEWINRKGWYTEAGTYSVWKCWAGHFDGEFKFDRAGITIFLEFLEFLIGARKADEDSAAREPDAVDEVARARNSEISNFRVSRNSVSSGQNLDSARRAH